MHATLRSRASTVMVSDATADRAGSPGDNFSIAIHAEDEAQTEAIFNKLLEGGKVTMPLQKTFWSARFGMLVDKFGIGWMVNCEAG